MVDVKDGSGGLGSGDMVLIDEPCDAVVELSDREDNDGCSPVVIVV